MRKTFISSLFFILFLGLALISSPRTYAFDGIVVDNGNVGVYHKLASVDNEVRAYVYFRLYRVVPDIETSMINTHDGSDDTYNAHFTNVTGFGYFNQNGTKEERTINAPVGFNKLKIVFDPFANFPAGEHETQYYNYFDISSLRIVIAERNAEKKLTIFDENNNELFNYKHTYAGDISIYWYGNTDITDDDLIIDIGSDFKQLPIVENSFYLFESINLYDIPSNSYTFKININGIIYKFNLSIPALIDMDKFKKGIDDYNISFTSDNEERVIYMQPDKSKPPFPITSGTVNNPADLLVGFITINLDKMTYDEVKKLSFSTIVNKESNKNAFMYLFFPMSIEKILNIHIKYDYQYEYLWGIDKSDWYKNDRIYSWDEESEINPPWWLYLGTLGAGGLIIDWLDVYNIETIKKVNSKDIPSTVKDKYVTNLKGNINDLNNLSLYKIHLAQFDKLGSTNYNIKNSSVANITYVFEGIVYQVPYENIDQVNYDPPISKPPLEDNTIAKIFEIILIVIYVLLGLVVLGIFYKILKVILRLFKSNRHYSRRKRR